MISDLDFLVEFDDLPLASADAYFGLKESLETLFGRQIDLITETSLEIRTSASACKLSAR